MQKKQPNLPVLSRIPRYGFESGHLIGAELAAQVNDDMLAFFAEVDESSIHTDEEKGATP